MPVGSVSNHALFVEEAEETRGKKKMKSTRTFLIGIFFGSGLIVGLHLLHAQETAMPVQAGAISAADWNSASDLRVMLQAVEILPTVSADSLPRCGTFYSAQHSPGSPQPWPPLPGNPNGLPVWNLGDGVYLLNDELVDYSMPLMTASMAGVRMMATDGPMPLGVGGGDDGTNDYEYMFTPPVYTTNDLWLKMVSITNGTASLVINTPWNVTNGVYDLFYTTNLAPSAWQWLGRCAPGQTNLTVNGLGDPQGFFILGLTNDTDGDGLTDAYELLVSHTNPTNSISNLDGIPDGWEILLGLNPQTSNVATASERSNYGYTPADWLNGVSGVKSGTISLDNEGNVLSVSQ